MVVQEALEMTEMVFSLSEEKISSLLTPITAVGTPPPLAGAERTTNFTPYKCGE